MKVIDKCPKCGKELVVKYDGKNMYFIGCSNKKCDFKDGFVSDLKQMVIDHWNSKNRE